jgi:hypothetical protein
LSGFERALVIVEVLHNALIGRGEFERSRLITVIAAIRRALGQ